MTERRPNLPPPRIVGGDRPIDRPRLDEGTSGGDIVLGILMAISALGFISAVAIAIYIAAQACVCP